MKKNDQIAKDLSSIGIAYTDSRKYSVNPEKVFIEVIKSNDLFENKKYVGLMLLWLFEYGSLIRVSYIKSLIDDLDIFHQAVVAGFALKMMKNGDNRWKKLIEKVQKNFGDKKLKFHIQDDPMYVRIKGQDKEFKEFGLSVAILLPENSKKLMKKEWIVKNNIWLKNRVIYGVNLKADIISLMSLKLSHNAYQAAKYLGCSFNSSYKIWNEIELVKGLL